MVENVRKNIFIRGIWYFSYCLDIIWGEGGGGWFGNFFD